MNETPDRITQAALWHARLRADDCDAEDRAAFAAWMAGGDRNRLAYADVCAAALAVEIDGLDAVEVAPVRPARSSLRGAAWGALFGGIALLGVLAGPRAWDDWRSDFTSGTEVRELALDDGSRVVLDADSALRVRFAAQREIELVRGAAWFDVGKDARPFVVRVGSLEARDIGTRFEVRRGQTRTSVAVAEGMVEVTRPGVGAPVRLAANEALDVADDAALPAPHAAGSDPGAWRGGQLVFSGTPLAEALERLDARMPERIVLLASRDARERPVTAIVPARDARVAALELARAQGLSVTEWPGVALVLR